MRARERAEGWWCPRRSRQACRPPWLRSQLAVTVALPTPACHSPPPRLSVPKVSGGRPWSGQVRVRPAAGGPRAAGCPKRMVFGPCGGVRDDGRCELAEHPLRLPRRAARRAGPSRRCGPRRRRRCSTRATRGPVVLADLSVTPFDPASVRRVVGVLAPVVRRAARRRARQPPRLPADDVRRRGDRRRRPRLDDAGLPRPQPRRPRAGAGRAGRGRGRRRPVRDRRRPRARACGPASPRCSTSTASGWPRSPRRHGPAGRRPRVAGGAAGRPAAGPGRREAAGRRAALRAQPREQPGAGRRLRRRRARGRARRCRSSPGSPSTPTSPRRGCCSASPACTWTTRSWSGCWPRPTRGRPGIAAAVAEARALLAIPGVVGVNLSGVGLEPGRGRRRRGQGRGGRDS